MSQLDLFVTDAVQTEKDSLYPYGPHLDEKGKVIKNNHWPRTSINGCKSHIHYGGDSPYESLGYPSPG